MSPSVGLVECPPPHCPMSKPFPVWLGGSAPPACLGSQLRDQGCNCIKIHFASSAGRRRAICPGGSPSLGHSINEDSRSPPRRHPPPRQRGLCSLSLPLLLGSPWCGRQPSSQPLAPSQAPSSHRPLVDSRLFQRPGLCALLRRVPRAWLLYGAFSISFACGSLNINMHKISAQPPPV